MVLIEDLISKGGSSASAVQAIRDANGSIDYCLSIFNYGLKEAAEVFSGKLPFDKNNNRLKDPCKTISILNYYMLLEVALEKDCIKGEQIKMLEEWRKDPWNWGINQGFPPKEKK